MKKKVDQKLDIENLSDIFHENTKIFSFNDLYKEIETPLWWKKIHFKSYPRFKKIILTKIKNKANFLENILSHRSSIREFNDKPINLTDLSKIIFYSAGIREKNKNWDESKRMYPSAGARYPLEVYIVVLNGRGIKNGIYHYDVKSNGLELIKLGNFKKKLLNFTNQDFIKKANCVIIITAVFDRTRIKYNQRGYRYILIEAGHMAQNVYLMATSIKIGCCSIGGFIDDEINDLIDLKNQESTIYLLVLGGLN